MLKVSKHSTTEDEIKKKVNDKKVLFMFIQAEYIKSPDEPTELLYTTLCFHFLTLELNV